ncbi:hypothetical protein G6F32_015775 [Rhizopus arrhizus]|nr:hypothetical protein G6F32_015775 [Rhizopus arrhizus]
MVMSLLLKVALACTPKPRRLSVSMSSGNDAVSSRPFNVPPLPFCGVENVPTVCTGAVMPGGDVALQVLVENRRGHVGLLAEVLLVGQVQCGGTPGVQPRITATAAGAAIVGIHAELQAGAHLVHARAFKLGSQSL